MFSREGFLKAVAIVVVNFDDYLTVFMIWGEMGLCSIMALVSVTISVQFYLNPFHDDGIHSNN